MNRETRIAAFVVMSALLVAQDGRADPSPADALADYVAQPDSSFAWTVRQRADIPEGEFCELTLTSQTWQSIVWKHQLIIIKPRNCDADAQHALLFVTGGSWKKQLASPPKQPTQINGELSTFARLAVQMKTPVAVLLHVPHQPIFDGKREDEIIAYTFDKFMESGNTTWPLLLPMVKSVVKGMDAVQEFSRPQWSLDLRTFTISGASKRGWTTWLTGAVDQRAVALAPMVIDVLNMPSQMKYQREVWGEYSGQIDDYTERGLQAKLETERGRQLTRIVDPFQYRQSLRQPKLIMIGTNDLYWPVDALKFYWGDLQGANYILYVPNNGHDLKDRRRVLGSLNALHQHVARGNPLPQLSWDFSSRAGTLELKVRSNMPPTQVHFWIASSQNRDFRKSRWHSQDAVKGQDGQYVHEIDVPQSGFAAMFAELVFPGDPDPYFLSTNLRVVGAPADHEHGTALGTSP